jgi:hypothetical protein
MAHTWKFFRAGDFDQVRLQSGSDLLALDQLDQKLWMALACPTSGLEFDSKTRALYLPGKVRSTSVLGTNAPAYMPPAATTNAIQMLPVK